jgi:hypothetical protein
MYTGSPVSEKNSSRKLAEQARFLRPSTVNLCECMPRIPEAWYPRRTSLGFSVNSPSYKLTCSVPLIVGGSPWLKGVWSNIPLKVPVPPEGMVVPSTLPP